VQTGSGETSAFHLRGARRRPPAQVRWRRRCGKPWGFGFRAHRRRVSGMRADDLGDASGTSQWTFRASFQQSMPQWKRAIRGVEGRVNVSVMGWHVNGRANASTPTRHFAPGQGGNRLRRFIDGKKVGAAGATVAAGFKKMVNRTIARPASAGGAGRARRNRRARRSARCQIGPR